MSGSLKSLKMDDTEKVEHVEVDKAEKPAQPSTTFEKVSNPSMRGPRSI
jgi:hypothetical protein